MKLKRRSYRHLRPKSKVEKAILMAEKIQRDQDPLRAVKPKRSRSSYDAYHVLF